MHQLVVQKAAHLLHVASGRGPAQPVASADLLQQHVDTGGLRSPPPQPGAVSTGQPAGAGPNGPPVARRACATLPARLASQGQGATPSLPGWLLPLSAGGSRGTEHRPTPGCRQGPARPPPLEGRLSPQLTLPPLRRAGSVLSRRRSSCGVSSQGTEPARSRARPRTPRICFLMNSLRCSPAALPRARPCGTSPTMQAQPMGMSLRGA